MFINDAFAQAAGATAQGSMASTMVQLVLIFIIFYFLLIRPQQRKIKQHEALLMTVKRGDKVLTGGGIVGTVEKVVGEEVDVTIATGVTVTVYRSTLRDVIVEKNNQKEEKTDAKKSSSEAKQKSKKK